MLGTSLPPWTTSTSAGQDRCFSTKAALCGASPDASLATESDDEQPSARRLIAPAWLPHSCKTSGAGLSAPIHATQH